ncbi:MAG: 30S ribosomal protein S20 [Dongiaceae bacterium]
MPVTKSAKKQMRVSARRNIINSARTSRMRTGVKEVESAIAKGDAKGAEAALRQAQKLLHTTASKGLMKRQTASRKISRLTKRIKKLQKKA